MVVFALDGSMAQMAIPPESLVVPRPRPFSIFQFDEGTLQNTHLETLLVPY
jgi:hypothetical protein